MKAMSHKLHVIDEYATSFWGGEGPKILLTF